MTETLPRTCPICGEHGAHRIERSFDPTRVDAMTFASRKEPELMHWSMAICRSCDLLFAVDPPSFDNLRTAYATAAFDADRESDAAARTYDMVLQRLVLEPLGWGYEGLELLDVGCGDGAFLGRAHAHGARRIVGIEISEEPIRRAPAGVREHIQREMVEEYRGQGFTVATGFQVWEHFSEPAKVMASLREVLVPGGLIVGVVHDRRAFVNRVMGRKSPIWDVEHLQLFSRASVESLVKRSHMRLVGMRHIANTYAAEYWARLAPLPPAVKRPVTALAGSKPFGHKINVRLPVGNLAFVAQKLTRSA